jgi:hypothetical protein
MRNYLRAQMLWLGIVGSLPLLAGGCSFSRTPHGWILRSGCTLEYTWPSRCAFAGPASRNCNAVEPGEIPCDTEISGETISASSAANMISNNENSIWLRMLQRRGRLGICANCKRLIRLQDPVSPPAAANAPIVPKFHPVPTQPVFTPREIPTEKPNLRVVPDNKRFPNLSNPSQLSIPSSAPEEIPPPPIPMKGEKSAISQDKIGTSQEESNWIFSKSPGQKPDPVVEAPFPSVSNSPSAPNKHAAQTSTRR